jgi:hypothetical protein
MGPLGWGQLVAALVVLSEVKYQVLNVEFPTPHMAMVVLV